MNGLTKIKNNLASSEIYDTLIKELKAFAKFQVEVKKTSLHIVNTRAFLGIHHRKNALLVNIVLSEALKNSRMKKVEKVSAHRYHNEVILVSKKEIDTQFIGWIRKAYAETQK